MREGAAAVAIAHCPNPLGGRAALIVDGDVAAVVGLDAGGLQTQVFSVRSPAHGQQNMAAVDAWPIVATGRADRDPLAFARQ
ncbi:hypothetical protein D9M68_748510 [compost metagenome]